MEPSNHRVNAVKSAIQTWKNHTIIRLCSINRNWTLQLWDQTMEQGITTLHLCHAPRTQLDWLTYHSYHGKKYDWNVYPMAPPGTCAVVYEDPKNRQSWAPGELDIWYCDPTFDHYHNMKFFVPNTGGHKMSGSFDLFL